MLIRVVFVSIIIEMHWYKYWHTQRECWGDEQQQAREMREVTSETETSAVWDSER